MTGLATYAGAPYAASTAAASTPAGSTDTFPTLALYFAPTSPPYGETPTWVDITTRILTRTPLRWRRGRDHALDETTASTFTVELDNTDRAFDPSYSSGPYYGFLGPNRLIQLRATWGVVEYVLGTWLVDGWEQRYVKADNHASVMVRATDTFRLLARTDFRPRRVFTLDRTDGQSRLDDGRYLADNYPANERERAGARIGRILTRAGFAETDLNLDPGRSPLVADIPEDDTLLPYLQRCAQTDLGRLYIDARGRVTFQDRSHERHDSSAITSQLTLSDEPDSTEAGYYDLVFDPSDERMLVNHARCGRDGKPPAVYRDMSSIELFGEARRDREDMLFASMLDASDQSRYLVTRFGTPQVRIGAVTLRPQRHADVLFPAVLGFELGTRVTVERTPVGVGSVFSQPALLEQVEHVVDLNRWVWSVVWSLSPADPTSYFRLDQTDGTSTLDTGMTLAY